MNFCIREAGQHPVQIRKVRNGEACPCFGSSYQVKQHLCLCFCKRLYAVVQFDCYAGLRGKVQQLLQGWYFCPFEFTRFGKTGIICKCFFI